MGVARDGDHPLGAGAVADVDLGAALVPDAVYGLPALADDRADLLAGGEAAQGEVDTRHIPGQLELGGHGDVWGHWVMISRIRAGSEFWRENGGSDLEWEGGFRIHALLIHVRLSR